MEQGMEQLNSTVRGAFYTNAWKSCSTYLLQGQTLVPNWRTVSLEKSFDNDQKIIQRRQLLLLNLKPWTLSFHITTQTTEQIVEHYNSELTEEENPKISENVL